MRMWITMLADEAGGRSSAASKNKHYCPRHWHVRCHDCDAAGSGAPDELAGTSGVEIGSRLSV